MQNFSEPLFRKGRVLKTESLEALRDFPLHLARLGLERWADGILFGYDIRYENGSVSVGAGAAWHQGQVVLTEAERLPFHAFEQQVTVCLRLYPGAYTEDFYVRQVQLRLKNGEAGRDEFELGRFRLSEGARLRKDYKDLRDCRTAYNTLDITQVPHAGPGGVTVSPHILRIFAQSVLESSSCQELDAAFALMCLSQELVARAGLLRYVARRLGEPLRELSHSEIFERLVRIAGMGGQGMHRERAKEGPAVF